MKFKTTKEIKIPSRTTDQVIGQDHAIDIIKKAAKQKRNVLLIGDPGVGKSLVGQALSELLPTEELLDVAAFPNSADENVPIIKTFTKGKGKEMISRAKIQAASSFRTQNWVILVLILIVNLLPYYFWKKGAISDVIYAASIISSIVFIVGFILFFNLGKRMKIGQENPIPKLLVDNSDRKYPPFIDATGSHTGSLLGDVLHDPLQSLKSSDIISVVGVGDDQVQLKKEPMKVIDDILKKHKKELIKKNTYVATSLDKNEMFLLAEKDGKVEPVEVLSVNRYAKKGDLIKLTTESGKELIVTPKHKVAIKTTLGKIKYLRADKIKPRHKLITLDF